MSLLQTHWRVMMCTRKIKEFADRQMQPFCTKHGITTRQLRVLISLYCTGPQTASTLARETCMAGANNSAVCKQLAAKGFVLRRRSEGDERQVLISLSTKGAELMRQFEEEVYTQAGTIACRIPKQQMEDLLQNMETALAAMEQEEEIAI